MSLSLVIGGKDYTNLAQNYSFSNVARGGFEQAQIEITAAADIRRGDEVFVYEGSDVAWHGRVNAPGTIAKKTKYRTGITCLGYGTALKDKQDRQIFVDCDYNHWTTVTNTRQQNNINAGFGPQPHEVNSDVGTPALTTAVRGAWAVTAKGVSEAMYTASGIELESLYYAWVQGSTINTADVNWVWAVYAGTDGGLSIVYGTANLRAAGPGTGTFLAPTTGLYYMMVQMYYSFAGSGGEEGRIYAIYWTKLAVYGRHKLTKRGTNSTTTAQGFYASDIVEYALRTVGGFDAKITPATDYIIEHLVYYDYVPVEQMVADAANFVGWMWGTWEPEGLFSNTPTFRFEPPPANPTISISTSECEDIDEPVASLDRSYNKAYISYRDSAGSQYATSVSIENPILTDARITERALKMDAGVATLGSAQTQGLYALRLSQSAGRGAGSVTVAGSVHSASGDRPATLVRAGRDRIRIPDLNGGDLFSSDTRSTDSFLVERVETTVTRGRATTRIEFDSGADLQEVLNARMQSQLTAAGLS